MWRASVTAKRGHAANTVKTVSKHTFFKNQKNGKIGKTAKILPKNNEKQGSKKEGVPGQNFIDYLLIFGQLWGQKGSKSSSRRGSIFEVKNGSEKIYQKSKQIESRRVRQSLARAIRVPFGPWGAGGKQPKQPQPTMLVI